MKKFLILTTSTMILAFATPVMASDDANCGDTSGKWMSRDAAKSIVVEKGYEVSRVKRDDGCYEIYAVDKNGARVEISINPVTGEIVKTKDKSHS